MVLLGWAGGLWWSVLVVISPFLLFYILSLFCVQLRVPVIRRASSQQEKPPVHKDHEKNVQENLDETRVL